MLVADISLEEWEIFSRQLIARIFVRDTHDEWCSENGEEPYVTWMEDADRLDGEAQNRNEFGQRVCACGTANHDLRKRCRSCGVALSQN